MHAANAYGMGHADWGIVEITISVEFSASHPGSTSSDHISNATVIPSRLRMKL